MGHRLPLIVMEQQQAAADGQSGAAKRRGAVVLISVRTSAYRFPLAVLIMKSITLSLTPLCFRSMISAVVR